MSLAGESRIYVYLVLTRMIRWRFVRTPRACLLAYLLAEARPYKQRRKPVLSEIHLPSFPPASPTCIYPPELVKRGARAGDVCLKVLAGLQPLEEGVRPAARLRAGKYGWSKPCGGLSRTDPADIFCSLWRLLRLVWRLAIYPLRKVPGLRFGRKNQRRVGCCRTALCVRNGSSSQWWPTLMYISPAE